MPRLFRRPAKSEPVALGERFRRTAYDAVETARVLAVVPDPAGIPHVRFQLQIERGCSARSEERTLALALFRDRYKEPVTA